MVRAESRDPSPVGTKTVCEGGSGGQALHPWLNMWVMLIHIRETLQVHQHAANTCPAHFPVISCSILSSLETGEDGDPSTCAPRQLWFDRKQRPLQGQTCPSLVVKLGVAGHSSHAPFRSGHFFLARLPQGHSLPQSAKDEARRGRLRPYVGIGCDSRFWLGDTRPKSG